jgi:hypothetical protein
MGKLYITGGQQRALRPLGSGNDWYEYQKGLILEVDPETRRVEQRVEYVSPPEAAPDEDPIILFKSASLVGERLYASTQTEVLVYAVPSFECLAYVSLPSFNDVHHVRPAPDPEHLLVAVSGLDLVQEITYAGEVVREWNVLGEEPWGGRFSRDTDYRKIRTTKPHLAHPNHLFTIGDEVWATRFEQKDAICLTDRERRIPLERERVHDGVVHGDRVYFTTVNGCVLIADPATLRVERTIDLGRFHEEGTILGWTRGLLVDDGGMWVGFSRIRPTKFRENVAWVARGFKSVNPTRIAYYDLESGRCTAEIDLEPAGLSAVFSILRAPAAD